MYAQHAHTQKVHYNETVDGRPLCRDPNSCSALGADHEQEQGETGSKQPRRHSRTERYNDTHHPHIFTNIRAPYYANAARTRRGTMWQISS